MHSTPFGSPETTVDTSRELVGGLVLRAEMTPVENDGVRTNTIQEDAVPTRSQEAASLPRHQSRPVTLPPPETSTAARGYFNDALHPPRPVTSSRPSSSRTTSRVPSRARLTPRRIETRSLPLITPPLSAGPSAYKYKPVSARPDGFEGLGPFERFPRAPNRNSLVGMAMSLCMSDGAVKQRLSSHVFAYTPGVEHSITRVKKAKWWKKGLHEVKKMVVGKGRK